MNRLGLFLSDVLIHSKQRSAFLEWLLFLSLFFVGDFLLNIWLIKLVSFLNLLVLILLTHFLYFIWLVLIFQQDSQRIRDILVTGQYNERHFKIFLSRIIPALFILSPGIGGCGFGFLLVFVFARPLGALMTKRAKIDWRSVYEVLRLEQESSL